MITAAVAVLVRCCCAGIPAPPCAARGLEKPPHFSLFKSYNSVDFFPILCFCGTLPKSTIFARARPPPLIFPFSFFEFSRSACAPQRGPRARTLRKFKKGKGKDLGPQNYGHVAFTFFVVLLLPLHHRPVPLLLCCALVCRDYCCCCCTGALLLCWHPCAALCRPRA